jgi:hypothetical protein
MPDNKFAKAEEYAYLFTLDDSWLASCDGSPWMPIDEAIRLDS